MPKQRSMNFSINKAETQNSATLNHKIPYNSMEFAPLISKSFGPCS